MTESGLSLASRDYGGHGTPIVLVHGLSSNLAIWDLVGPRLARTHRVIAYDQRGHGLSDSAGDFSFESLASDLEGVITAYELDRPVVVGHSWGASVALHYASTRDDVRGIVCVDGGIADMQGLGADWETTEQLLRPPKIVGSPDEILERIKQFSVLPWEVVEPVVLRGRVLGEDGLSYPKLPMDDHMAIVRAMWEQRTWDLYPKIAAPVMLVIVRGKERSEWDERRERSVEEIRERRDDVRVEWIESIHDVPLHEPDGLAALIEDFALGL